MIEINFIPGIPLYQIDLLKGQSVDVLVMFNSSLMGLEVVNCIPSVFKITQKQESLIRYDKNSTDLATPQNITAQVIEDSKYRNAVKFRFDTSGLNSSHGETFGIFAEVNAGQDISKVKTKVGFIVAIYDYTGI